MKLTRCCVFAAFVTVSLAAIDVEKTVKQVQSILQANQQLPRLTRDDILELLNDLRAEDVRTLAKKDNVKKEITTSPYAIIENEIDMQVENTPEAATTPVVTTTDTSAETTPKANKSTLMVVLPYTPRDGSSLQELYTRPPRVEVVHVSSTTPRPKTAKPTTSSLKDNAGLPTEIINNFPGELQAFLNAHGLKPNPGQDHFLLPLEGFKPLPPAKVIDGAVQLPENLLLTYDLISPTSDSKPKTDQPYSMSPSNFLYAPLQPELPFELDTSSSETKEVNLPYDMPAKKPKSVATPNYDPIEYDSVKVIPLNKGVNPVDEPLAISNDQSKRQASVEETTTSTTTTTEEPKTNGVNDSSSTDTGASISDLEDSFGGAAPAQPGDSELPPPRKNGFYWTLDWNSFLEVGDGDTKVNIRFEPKLGDPQMFLPVTVP